MLLFLSLCLLCWGLAAGSYRGFDPCLAGIGPGLLRTRHVVLRPFGLRPFFGFLLFGHRDGDGVLDEEVERLLPGQLLFEELVGTVLAHGLGDLRGRPVRALGYVTDLVHSGLLIGRDALGRRDRV